MTTKLKNSNSDEQVQLYRLIGKNKNMCDDALKNYTVMKYKFEYLKDLNHATLNHFLFHKYMKQLLNRS